MLEPTALIYRIAGSMLAGGGGIVGLSLGRVDAVSISATAPAAAWVGLPVSGPEGGGLSKFIRPA